jgi:hypothetical protein
MLNGEQHMDLLRSAVVDITTLAATCRALKSSPLEGDLAVQGKLRSRLRRELKRGTVAYIDTLARTKRTTIDEAFLATCRTASEKEMAHAMAHQRVLGRIMASEAGSLEGLAAARQDLWRLAHISIYLRVGMTNLGESDGPIDTKSALSLADRLRRRFRKALIAYARATLRTRHSAARLIIAARAAALAEIGKRGAVDAERLADMEAAGDPAGTVIRLGVSKPLVDLALDWQRHLPGAK